MNRPRDILFFWFLFQIGTRGSFGHNDGTIGDIGFKCPSGSKFYEGYCFRKVTVPMTWKDAETACLRSGMYLAWIEDDIENQYVATEVMSDVNQYWIGLSNTTLTAGQSNISWSQYRMLKDQSIKLVEGLWKNLEPAKFEGDNKCVSTLKDKNDNHWAVTNCRKKLPFVCKLLGAPKPHDVIFCGNGGYIHKKWKCDGQNDCGDMSDEIECSTSCSELKTIEKGGSGSITMSSFDNYAFCTWTIQAPVGVRIKITISSGFHLEENADVLRVWTGGITLKESNLLGSVTGKLQAQKEFYSQNNYIIIQLSMDGSGNVKSAFTVNYETVADSVIWNDLKQLTANSTWQNLMSPLYGSALPLGLQLEWLITAGTYSVVSLEFSDIDLPLGSSLKIYDGEDLMAPEVFSFQKTPVHPIYISRSKSVRIVLSTDQHEYAKFRGFHLKYKEGCSLMMKQQGTIYSPGYQVKSYPSNVTCTWLLTLNSGETRPISLRFTDFKLKENSDFVEVYNDTTGTKLHTGNGLTGTSDVNDVFSSSTGHLNVTFKSNLVLVEKGFMAEFSVDCPVLTLSQWTINSMSEKYTALNKEIVLSCQPGYSFKQEEYNQKSSVSLKCLPGGKWNVSRIPDCQITYCSTPPAIQNGILKSASGPRVGDNATYECNGGFTLSGSNTIRCQEDGSWEAKPTCNAQQCSQQSDPANGKVNTTAGSGTDYASVLMFYCDPGYDLVGSVYIYCRSNGTWSYSAPTCQKIKCPIPQVMYGKVEATGDVAFEEKTKLKCDPGFVLNDTSSPEKDIICGSDGQFADLDLCVNDDECAGGTPCSSAINTECVDTIGSYVCKCNDGFDRDGSSGSCNDIDECNVNKGGCSDRCSNSQGSYSCECNAGFSLYSYPDFNNVSLAEGETGKRAGDKIRINHTCVRVLCPTPVSPMNGKILSNKELFYYEDKISVQCDHGYFLNPDLNELTCENSGQWSANMPNCTKGSCTTPSLSDDPNYNKIFPSENATVEFGKSVIIECKYGTSYRNLSLYCGERGMANYKLLGDNLTCPVIDCGTPEKVPGTESYGNTDTLYGSSFNFSCQSGTVLSGTSIDGDYTVTCQENRRWSFGNLTCTVGRCTDPGTPGGAVQVVRSYEAGEFLTFKCMRDGFEPVPSAPLLCEQKGNDTNWNSTLPLCTDVTPPKFSNCPMTPFYVDQMEAVTYNAPTATDNSGLVKNVTVMPSNFKSGTVISEDVNVTYTAVDNNGNMNMCTISFMIKDRKQPSLFCVNKGPWKINSTEGRTIDLNDSSTDGNKSYSPDRYITFNVSTLNKPQQVNITMQDKWGTTNKCTMLLYTKAAVCFEQSLPSISNAVRTCSSSGQNLTCKYVCRSGYVYYDGNSSKTYECSGENKWSPSAIPENCLKYETPSYKAKFDVTYNIDGSLAGNCLASFKNALATYNTTIAGRIDNLCSLLDAGKFVVNSVDSVSLTFKITSTFRGEFSGSKEDKSRETCINLLESVTDHSYVLPFSAVSCSDNSQATVTVDDIRNPEVGNKCNDNFVLVSGGKCVQCPPGFRYLSGNTGTCELCADGMYQNELGQTTCKACGANTVSSGDRTTCIAKCPPGFKSENGLTDCQPCDKDTYWVNATHCEQCPAGYITTVLNGVSSIEGCKAPCSPGKFSLTGHEPCQECPLHHYQDKDKQTSCTECDENKRTDSTGSNSTSDCVGIVATECNSTNCIHGECKFQNHEAVCVCSEGYKGVSCGDPLVVCDSNPCFNGGTCIQNGNSFNCTCPSTKLCSLVQHSDNLVVADGDYESVTKLSIDACKTICQNDEKCKAMYHVNGFCFIVYKDVTPKPYADTSPYFYKVCNHTYLYSGSQCETDLVNECKPETCSSYGMCQDRAQEEPICLCPIVGEYSQPKCEVVENLCSPDPCKNGAECKSWGAVRRQCICKPGYTGVNCSEDIDECQSNMDGCLYGGTCQHGADSYTCLCMQGFSGRHCQIPKDFCSGTPCPKGGCVNNYVNLTENCFCDYPYQLGSNGQCKMMNLCNGTNCNNGTCNPATGKCRCDEGYEGSLCQHSVDDCVASPCKNNGTCVDGYKDYSCLCLAGYEGKDCQIDQNDCPGFCNVTYTASTVDRTGYCECVCKDGYTGKNCSEEVDECASFPCKHGATCTDQMNNYLCNCTEGWTGKNCENQIDFCKTTARKCQSGDCYNLIDDKYCRCNAGTRGDVCEDIPDVCSVISSCTSMGNCKNSNGTAECDCQPNYSGKSCQLVKDFCTGTTTCLYNGTSGAGGTCTNLENGGYKCTCHSDYFGTNCQSKTTLCSTLSCGSEAKCFEEIGCLCPEGKVLTEGKICKTDPSTNFDILFDPQIEDEGAYTTAVLPDPENSDLSVMLWVKFNADQKDTDDAVLLQMGSFVKIKNSSITISNDTKDFVIDFKISGTPIEMDNGKWHIIVGSWKRSGETLVTIDSLQIFTEHSVSGLLPKMFKVEIGKKFSGRISQVKVWANSLSIGDVYKLDENKDHTPDGSIVVHGWYNYKMTKGAFKKSPSQYEKDVCDVPACSKDDKIKPKVKTCPSDSARYSPDRIYEHTFALFKDMFEDFNDSLSLSSHPKGNTFIKGDYSLLFMASDDAGNTAMCYSKLYVKYNEDCPPPQTSAIVRYCSNSKDICDLECTDSGQQLSIPAPKNISCSKLGVYNPLKPREKFVLPSCGDSNRTSIQIDVSLMYSLSVSCSVFYQTLLETTLINVFKNKVSTEWNNICMPADCTNVKISATCIDKAKNMTVEMKIQNLENEITKKSSGSEKYTAKEVFRVLIFEDNVFEAEVVGGAKVLNDQVMITDVVSCSAGYMVIGDSCVQCGKGSFYNSTTQNCEYCPVGKYGSSAGLSQCELCGLGKTTLGVGSNDTSDCIDDCKDGQYWDNTKCSLCPKHFYQNMTGKDYCFPCPLGKKTSDTGSNSSTQCFDDCEQGTELTPDGTCVKCKRGYYRSYLQDSCMQCPAGSTTAGNGSTSDQMCDITICYNGTYRNSTTNLCVDCPVGEYQPMDLQEGCMKCKVNYTTESEGKNNKSDCKFFCPKGYEILAANTETCRECPRGYYKNNSDVFSNCTACPSGNTTEDTKSTSKQSCSINMCSSGQQINSGGECSDCELDFYQPKDMPTSSDKCQKCSDGKGTKQKMTNSSDDCLPTCLEGTFYNETSKMCEKCPKGTWNNGNFTMKFETCVACPANMTTTGPGMISEDNCTVLDCSPGSYISGTDCLPCDFGFYQPNRHQDSCLACKPNQNTSSTGASTGTECQLYCGAGLEGQNSCTDCKDGFYKSVAGSGMCLECTGNYTSNDKHTECNKLFCDKGFRFDNNQNSCMACDIGYYKQKRGNDDKCTKCDDGLLTANIASTASDDCNQPFCVPGKYVNSSGVCAPCMKGFYKGTTGNDNCTACPMNATTPSEGSIDLSYCSIVVCNAGEKRDNSTNTCMKCPLGSYQPNRGEGECVECSDGQTTEQEGTVNMAGCVPICPTGKEFESSTKTCKKCSLGYYKEKIGNSENCKVCPTGYTTKFTGSNSSADCSVRDCLPGTYRSSGGCESCPVGQYQDEKSQDACKNCPDDKNTTETTGADSLSYCIKFCPAGQEYDRITQSCKNCPQDFHTNRTISQYCIKCPPGKVTYGDGSAECTELKSSTQAPVVEQVQTYKFILTYRVRVDCSNEVAKENLRINIKARIINRLRTLATKFTKFCKLLDASMCFASLRVDIKNCPKSQIRRKRATADTDLGVEVSIPDVGETVIAKDDPNKVLRTETMLQEDLATQKTEYAPPQTELQSFKYEGQFATCSEGFVLTSNNQSCVACSIGSYYNTTDRICVKCSRNFYQDEPGKTSCKQCSGSVRMYTLSDGSTAERDCVSACKADSSYCKNGGTCNSNEVTIWCSCKERFTGPRCQEQSELTSDTPYIIGGAVGGLAAIMIIALVTISIVRCLKSSKDSKEKYPDMDYGGYDYNMPIQKMYDNNSKRGVMPDYSRMNPSFAYDDGQFEDSFSRGRYPYRDDSSAYRWQESTNYDL